VIINTTRHFSNEPGGARILRGIHGRDARATARFRRLVSEFLTFIVFAGLTLVMTWPWIWNLRDNVADEGDSYLNTWILWWDYHQTFTHPLQLFDANIMYPYRYTLAFSEHGYGIAAPFFPLFALGFRPLTINGIATLAGFALCGYGAFRLSRTLTGSTGGAWVAGIFFAFVPYRFHQLPHIMYIWAGWIPLLLEALVLYARRPNRPQAVWLGVAFFMNGLTCIHWFVLTLIPLMLTGIFLVWRQNLWRDRKFWLRAAVVLGIAAVALLPFLAPYAQVARLYGLVRGPAEVNFFSALPINWLTVDWQNKFWKGLGSSVSPYQTELALFPGLLPLLLTLVAFTVRDVRTETEGFRWWSVRVLDGLAIGALILALLSAGYPVLRLPLFGIELFHASSTWWTLMAVAAGTFVTRCVLAPPRLPGLFLKSSRSALDRSAQVFGILEIGLIWAVIGFFGSLGMHFFFHRMLYKYVFLFRSIRVPARWAMICFVGLSLLAGFGAARLANRFALNQSRWIKAAAFAVIACLLLFEQRSAPLSLVRGATDPDPITLKLKHTTMKGGIVELPAGVGSANYIYTLRASDHARPLVDGVSGFRPPIEQAVEEMSQSRPISNRFLDLLEAIPVSYLVVHHAALDHESEEAVTNFLNDATGGGRLRLVERFGSAGSEDELFVLTKTEPDAVSAATVHGNV
jgi:hypothetical protein